MDFNRAIDRSRPGAKRAGPCPLRPSATTRRPWRYWFAGVLATALTASAIAFTSPGCGVHPPLRRGLYISLGYSFYPQPLQAEAALRAEAFDVVFPELGVFDPQRATLSDFADSLRVPLLDSDEASPAWRALESLPARCRRTFGPQVAVVAWVFLARTPEQDTAGRPRAGQTEGFDPGDPGHRDALARAARRLETLGFDGIQLDLEPFPASDVPDMRRVLSAVRDATGKDFIRAIFCPKYAAAETAPGANPGFTWHARRPYRRLARRSDQIIVPLYDYGMLAATQADYRQRVSATVETLLPRFPIRSRYWLAIPSYRHTPDHPPPEAAETALEIIMQSHRRVAGVAFFVHTGNPVDYMPDP